jgi:hypothetical protein
VLAGPTQGGKFAATTSCQLNALWYTWFLPQDSSWGASRTIN